MIHLWVSPKNHSLLVYYDSAISPLPYSLGMACPTSAKKREINEFLSTIGSFSNQQFPKIIIGNSIGFKTLSNTFFFFFLFSFFESVLVSGSA